jgi:hypothetical protein
MCFFDNCVLFQNGSTSDGWVELPSLRSVTQLACGGDHALARTSDGRVLAWGWSEVRTEQRSQAVRCSSLSFCCLDGSAGRRGRGGAARGGAARQSGAGVGGRIRAQRGRAGGRRGVGMGLVASGTARTADRRTVLAAAQDGGPGGRCARCEQRIVQTHGDSEERQDVRGSWKQRVLANKECLKVVSVLNRMMICARNQVLSGQELAS